MRSFAHLRLNSVPPFMAGNDSAWENFALRKAFLFTSQTIGVETDFKLGVLPSHELGRDDLAWQPSRDRHEPAVHLYSGPMSL